MAYVNSKKFGSTVQHYKKENGDISYYITYKDEFNKLKRIKVGDLIPDFKKSFSLKM